MIFDQELFIQDLNKIDPKLIPCWERIDIMTKYSSFEEKK